MPLPIERTFLGATAIFRTYYWAMTDQPAYHLESAERTTLVLIPYRDTLAPEDRVTAIELPLQGDMSEADIEEFLGELRPGYWWVDRKRGAGAWGGGASSAEIVIEFLLDFASAGGWAAFGVALDRLLDRWQFTPPTPSEPRSQQIAISHTVARYGEVASRLELVSIAEDLNACTRTFGLSSPAHFYEIEVRSTRKGFEYVSGTKQTLRYPDATSQ